MSSSSVTKIEAVTSDEAVTIVEWNGMRLCIETVPSTDEMLAWGRRQDRRQQRDARRQHRLRTNGPRDLYTVEDLGHRDSWTCGICGDPVDRDLRAPDLECKSIDHIVSVAKGGPDTLANVRLAHLGCNLDRNVNESRACNQLKRAGRLARRGPRSGHVSP